MCLFMNLSGARQLIINHKSVKKNSQLSGNVFMYKDELLTSHLLWIHSLKQDWTWSKILSHFKGLWIKPIYVLYSGGAPLLDHVLTMCSKQVKVNTPHLWFSLLTHSQWKWVLFIFQTASRISDPKKKRGERGKKNKAPRAGIHLWCFEKKDSEKLQSGFMHIVLLRKELQAALLVLIVISYASSHSISSILIF